MEIQAKDRSPSKEAGTRTFGRSQRGAYQLSLIDLGLCLTTLLMLGMLSVFIFPEDAYSYQ